MISEQPLLDTVEATVSTKLYERTEVKYRLVNKQDTSPLSTNLCLFTSLLYSDTMPAAVKVWTSPPDFFSTLPVMKYRSLTVPVDLQATGRRGKNDDDHTSANYSLAPAESSQCTAVSRMTYQTVLLKSRIILAYLLTAIALLL